MKKNSFLKERSFKEYMDFLSESMSVLEEYRARTGQFKTPAKEVKEALQHGDPFVTYKATIAATMLLADNSLYH